MKKSERIKEAEIIAAEFLEFADEAGALALPILEGGFREAAQKIIDACELELTHIKSQQVRRQIPRHNPGQHPVSHSEKTQRKPGRKPREPR